MFDYDAAVQKKLNQDINLEEKYINKSESDQELLDLSNIINE